MRRLPFPTSWLPCWMSSSALPQLSSYGFCQIDVAANTEAGVYISHFAPKNMNYYNMSYWLVGRKIWWFIKKKKNANIRGKRCKKGGKMNFLLYLRGKIWFLIKKGGGGKNNNYLDNIHPWAEVNSRSQIPQRYSSRRGNFPTTYRVASYTWPCVSGIL